MTDSYLEAIRARLRAATPGPWTNDMREVWTANGTHCICDAYVDEIESGECGDATFIANAPADIAALLAEVEKLRAKRCSYCEHTVQVRLAVQAERDAAHATVKAQAEMMRRVVKYAYEDRMVTPGTTRLQRVLDEMERAL